MDSDRFGGSDVSDVMASNLRPVSRSEAARPAERQDEREAWEQLFARLSDYSAAVAVLEQVTLRWLEAQDEGAAQGLPATGDRVERAGAEVEMAEAVCRLTRRRCAEALKRLEAFEDSARPPANLIPWPGASAQAQPPRRDRAGSPRADDPRVVDRTAGNQEPA